MGHKAYRGFSQLYCYRNKPIPIFLRGRFTSPLPLSTGPCQCWSSFANFNHALKKCCSRSSQSYIYDLFFLDGRHFLACKFRTMPFFIRGVAKIEGGGTVI